MPRRNSGSEGRDVTVASTRSPAETQRLARELGRLCESGDVIALAGDLGAGKTCFAQGLAAGLGVEPRQVVSPTFTLVAQHAGRLPFHHIDLYRLADAGELDELGLRDVLGGDGVAAVEWMDRFAALYPGALWVRLETAGPRARRIVVRAGGERAADLLAAWQTACARRRQRP